MFKLFMKSVSCRIWMIVSAVVIALVIVVNVLSQTMLYDLFSLVIGAATPIYEEGVTPMYIPGAMSKTEEIGRAHV